MRCRLSSWSPFFVCVSCVALYSLLFSYNRQAVATKREAVQGYAADARKQGTPAKPTAIVQPCFEEDCVHWTDTSGHRIEAHAAGMLQSPLDQRWYWYGESKKYSDTLWNWDCFNTSQQPERVAVIRQAAPGINLYSAADIAGPWRFEGQVIKQADVVLPGGPPGPWILERPKVLFNPTTRMFVMWLHLENTEYTFRHAGVFAAAAAVGPWVFKHALQPDGIPSLDMSLFKDPLDDQAYFVRSCSNQYTAISRLSTDYLTSTGVISKGPLVEGMGIFRHHNGTYYMITSHLSGWDPNPLVLYRAAGKTLDNPMWVDMGNPTRNEESFNSQPTFVVEYKPANGVSYFVYMADNWVHAGPDGLRDAAYVWLPFHFDEHTVRLEKQGVWDLEEHTILNLAKKIQDPKTKNEPMSKAQEQKCKNLSQEHWDRVSIEQKRSVLVKEKQRRSDLIKEHQQNRATKQGAHRSRIK